MTGRKTETNIPIEIAENPDVLSTDEDRPFTSFSPITVDNSHAKLEISDSKPLQKTRKRTRSDQIDDLLALRLANDIAYAKNGDSKKTTNPEDQDILFCSSLVTTFRNLTGKKNKLAKIKVLQVLAEFEDDDEM